MENSVGTRNEAQWWRWPLLPFAAIWGGMLGAFLLTLIGWFGMKMQGGFSEDGWYFRYILPITSSAMFGWFYVLITLNVAPKGKVIASVVMTTVLGVLSCIGLLFIWLNPQREIAAAVQSTLGSIASVGAAIVAIVSSKDEYTE